MRGVVGTLRTASTDGEGGGWSLEYDVPGIPSVLSMRAARQVWTKGQIDGRVKGSNGMAKKLDVEARPYSK